MIVLVGGLVLASVPLLQFLSGLVLLFGAVLIVGGRGTFGRTHGAIAVGSIPLLAAALVAGVAFGAQFNAAVATAASPQQSGQETSESIRAASNVLLVGGLIVTVLSSTARVLLVASLLTKSFQVLLLIALALEVSLGVLIFLSMQPLVDAAVAAAYSSGPFNPDPIRTFQGKFVAMGFLYAIPLSLFVAACFSIVRRIRRREIPGEPPASRQSSRILRPAAEALQYSSPPLASPASSSEGYESRDISQTRLGLGCLCAGAIVAALPLVGILGDLVVLCGISALALGRGPFGTNHRWMVLVALVISIVAVVWFRSAFFAYGFNLVDAASRGSPLERANLVRAAFVQLRETILPAILLGVGYSIVSMGLQSWRGIAVLGTGLIATVLARVYAVEGLRPAFELAATQVAAGGSSGVIVPALGAKVAWMELLALAPAGVFTIAFFLALYRVRQREIP